MTRKGTLTGGYYDSRRSKLENQRMIEELSSRLEELEGERSTISHQLQDVSLPPVIIKYMYMHYDIQECLPLQGQTM